MFIYDYKPNGFGPDEYYEYTGNLSSLIKVQASNVHRSNGWLMTCRDFMCRKINFVIFGRDKCIFIHTPDGVFNYSNGEVGITQRRFLNLLFVTLTTKAGVAHSYKIYTPISRFLSNDGMFPGDVEPLSETLNRLKDEKEHRRLADSLTDGILKTGVSL